MTAFDRGWQSLASLAAPLVERATRNRSEGATDMPLNCMTIDELRDLGKIITAVIDTGEELSLRNIEITADMTPGSVVTMTLVDCVVPVVMGEAVAEVAEGAEPESWQSLEDAIREVMRLSEDVGVMAIGAATGWVEPVPVPEVIEVEPAPEPDTTFPAKADIPPAPAEPEIPASAPAAEPAPALKTGPLDDAERATIQRLNAGGMDRATIAAKIGRRVQSVALYLTSLQQTKSRATVEAMSSRRTARQDDRPAAILPPLPAAPVADLPRSPAEFWNEPARPDGEPLPVWHAAIGRHLDKLGYPGAWSAGLDLDLAEGLAKGIKLNMLAADFGLDASALRARFAALTACVRDERDMMTIDQQKRLLTVLKLRAQAKGAAA